MLLCLFDDTGAETRIALPDDAGVWHGFVEGVGAARPGPPAKVHRSEPTCDPAHHLFEQLLPAAGPAFGCGRWPPCLLACPGST
jgi:hypothetical protein